MTASLHATRECNLKSNWRAPYPAPSLPLAWHVRPGTSKRPGAAWPSARVQTASQLSMAEATALQQLGHIFSRKAQLKQQVPRIPTHALRCAVPRLDLPRSSSLLESTHLMWWPVDGGPSRWHVTCGNPAPTPLTQPAFLVSVLLPQSSCRFDGSFCALHPATVHGIISGPGQSMCLATTAVRA